MKSLFVTFFFLLSFAAYGVPNVFTSGTTISSSQMNANFNYFETTFWTKNSTSLVYTAGRIGIGTVNPDRALTVASPDASTGSFLRDFSVNPSSFDSLGSLGFGISNTVSGLPHVSAGISAVAAQPWAIGIDQGTALAFETTLNFTAAKVERMRITDQGFVGIGTNGPLNILHVKNAEFETNIQVENDTSTGSARIIHKNGTSEFSTGITMDYWSIQEAGTERLRIDPTGRVGIGTSAPAAQLDVAGSVRVGSMLDVASNVQIATQLDVAGDAFLYGNVGIGTGAPTAKLQVGMSADGSSALANAWNTFSDERLKRNFSPIQDPLAKLSAISGQYYFWKKGKDQRRKMGVKAQEVEKVFPEVVETGADGIKTVSYGHLIAPLIEAIKELHVRVLSFEKNVQTSRLPASEEKLKKLEAENAMLKSYLCQKDPAAPFCKSER